MGDSLEHHSQVLRIGHGCLGLLYTTPALPALHPPHPSPESIISLNRPPGNVDDYVGALPYLHCGGEKGKPCTYFETLCLCHMSSANFSFNKLRKSPNVSNLDTHGTIPTRSDIHKITKIPRLHCKLPPNHSLTLSHPACIVCIIGVRERGIAPFLASVTDNGFKSVAK